jgi:DNA polymerase-3 subunit alpha
MDSFGDRKDILKWLHDKKGKAFIPFTDEQLMLKFYENVGFFEQKLKKVRGTFKKSVISESEIREYGPGEYALIGGMVSEVRSIKTKRGDKMGFATIVDLDERIEVTCFPDVWHEYRNLLHCGNIVEIGGIKSTFNGRENAIEAQLVEQR